MLIRHIITNLIGHCVVFAAFAGFLGSAYAQETPENASPTTGGTKPCAAFAITDPSARHGKDRLQDSGERGRAVVNLGGENRDHRRGRIAGWACDAGN